MSSNPTIKVETPTIKVESPDPPKKSGWRRVEYTWKDERGTGYVRVKKVGKPDENSLAYQAITLLVEKECLYFKWHDGSLFDLTEAETAGLGKMNALTT